MTKAIFPIATQKHLKMHWKHCSNHGIFLHLIHVFLNLSPCLHLPLINSHSYKPMHTHHGYQNRVVLCIMIPTFHFQVLFLFLTVALTCFSLFLCFAYWYNGHCHTGTQAFQKWKTVWKSWDISAFNACVAQCFSLCAFKSNTQSLITGQGTCTMVTKMGWSCAL